MVDIDLELLRRRLSIKKSIRDFALELLQGVLVDAPQVGSSNNSPLTKTRNGLFSTLSSIDKTILANKSSNMLTAGTDEHSAVGNPVGVNGASVWVSLDSNDRCRTFPLNRVESIANFAPVKASFTWP